MIDNGPLRRVAPGDNPYPDAVTVSVDVDGDGAPDIEVRVSNGYKPGGKSLFQDSSAE